VYTNPSARTWTCEPAPREARDFHAGLPGYHPSPLIEIAPRVFVKDESDRFGLPAFKILGASWAIQRALTPSVRRLVAATDGNHGRAVARIARERGLDSLIVIPRGVSDGAVVAIAAEGAQIRRLPISYDEAVEQARLAAGEPGSLLIQDTSWPGYEEIPQSIVDGYSTLFAELDEQLAGEPELVVVPAGVGSLAQAAVTHYRGRGSRTTVTTVEPEVAACVLTSLEAGRLTTIETGATIMAGLNCGTPSALAWPYLKSGLDAAVAVSNEECRQAMRELHAAGVGAGPCGAASLAGYRKSSVQGVVVLLSTEARQHL
jgi:diaminopropionate ammonia-lyase